jgi:signal transduction histidine kinase
MVSKNNLQSIEVALRERVKELTCLYEMSELAYQDNLSFDELINNTLKLIPPAWQYPEYTVARIILDNHQYNSAEFKDLPFRLAEEIIINGQHRGTVEVFYIKSMPEADEGPFLKEERKLIQAIARKIALIIERKETLEEKQGLYEQIRHADRLRTIGEFTAGIAHEINEPLGNILGYAQLIIKNNDLPQQVKQDLEIIIKASLNAREIIKKLMYFSHQMPQRFEEVDLNHIIKEAMYFLETQCSKENILVSYSLAVTLPTIIADPIQLNQVIVNLVVNSIQAMPGGGKLTLATFSNPEFVFLKVEDSGPGIPEDIKKNIFKPFFTTKEIDRGTGLGLSVVHGIITAHNGYIKVESEQDKGTIFEIQFPVINTQNAKTKY